MQTQRNDHLDADIRHMDAARACVSEECVNEQLEDRPREDPLLGTLDERKVDYGMRSDRDS